MVKVKRIRWEKMRHARLWYYTVVCLAVFIFAVRGLPAAAKQSPTIQLFPTIVVENIKHTVEAAKAMEQQTGKSFSKKVRDDVIAHLKAFRKSEK